jgi:hypothetical protein
LNLVELPDEQIRVMRPDLAKVQRLASSPAPQAAAGALALEPVSVPVAILEEFRQAYIEILHRPSRTLVAVLELLSPGNKAEPGRGDYLVKRNAIFRQPVHLVELDLLVGGRRLPMARRLPAGDYYALVARGDRRPDCDVYAWTVRQPLPSFRVPLLAPDPDILIDSAAVYTTAYERGRFARSIEYVAPLSVPLGPDDRAWAEEQGRSTIR